MASEREKLMLLDIIDKLLMLGLTTKDKEYQKAAEKATAAIHHIIVGEDDAE